MSVVQPPIRYSFGFIVLRILMAVVAAAIAYGGLLLFRAAVSEAAATAIVAFTVYLSAAPSWEGPLLAVSSVRRTIVVLLPWIVGANLIGFFLSLAFHATIAEALTRSIICLIVVAVFVPIQIKLNRRRQIS